jgi:molybdopterin synthase catalytic subunit
MQLLIQIDASPLEPRPASSHLEGDAGAVIEFAGVVRNTENGSPIEGLHYESYTPMAQQEITRISNSLNAKHPILSLDFYHRTGFVKAGDASLFVRIRSERRINALRFLEHLIDLLKEDVPIWKSPIFAPRLHLP